MVPFGLLFTTRARGPCHTNDCILNSKGRENQGVLPRLQAWSSVLSSHTQLERLERSNAVRALDFCHRYKHPTRLLSPGAVLGRGCNAPVTCWLQRLLHPQARAVYLGTQCAILPWPPHVHMNANQPVIFMSAGLLCGITLVFTTMRVAVAARCLRAPPLNGDCNAEVIWAGATDGYFWGHFPFLLIHRLGVVSI